MFTKGPTINTSDDQVVYLDNWRNKRFVIWTLAIPLALFGYFVPYVHLVRYTSKYKTDNSNSLFSLSLQEIFLSTKTKRKMEKKLLLLS